MKRSVFLSQLFGRGPILSVLSVALFAGTHCGLPAEARAAGRSQEPLSITQPSGDETQAEDLKDTDEPAVDGLEEPQEKPPGIKDESKAIDPSNKDALAWYMVGQKAFRTGDFESAAEGFREASKADPTSAVPVRALAITLMRMGKPNEGLAKAGEAMKLDPNDYETRLEVAILMGSNGRFQDSAALLESALASKTLAEKSFDFIHIHQVRGAVLFQMRKLSEAADSYELILKALERPEDFNLTQREHKMLLKNKLTGYEFTGQLLLQAGRVPKSIEAFEALSRTEKDAPGDHNLYLARAYFQQDKLELCEQNLNRYFETGRRNNDSLLLLRDLYEATNRSDSLIKRLEELTTDASDALGVKMFLGQILLDQGKTQEAATLYRSILESGNEADAYLGLIRVEITNRNPQALIETISRGAKSGIKPAEFVPLVVSIATVEGFAKETVTTCQKMVADTPDDIDPQAPFFCSLIASELEMLKEEGELLKATLELNPDRELSVMTLDKYGSNQLRQGEYAKAAKLFEQMLQTPGLQPLARVNALFRISAAYASIEDLGAARKALRMALEIVPDEPQLLGRLALVEAADGKLDVAKNLMLKSIEGLETNPELLAESRIRLAGIHAQLDEWDAAIEQYSIVVDMEPVDPDTHRLARMGLSNAYVQSGNMAKGQEVLEQVYEEDPTDPGVNNDLGYLYADQGTNLEKAEQMIRIAVEAQPANPAYLDSLGWVLFKQGKLEDALEALKKANATPDYEDATLMEHEGDVHQAMKNDAEAKALWTKSKEVEEKARQPDREVLKRLNEKLGEKQ